MKIAKGHYVPKELITSEAVHEAVVKAFVAAGFKDERPTYGDFKAIALRMAGDGLVAHPDGGISWTEQVSDTPLTLQQLFTAENGISWPDWAESVDTDGKAVWFHGRRSHELISGEIGSGPVIMTLATRQPKEKEVVEQCLIDEFIIKQSGVWPDAVSAKSIKEIGEVISDSFGELTDIRVIGLGWIGVDNFRCWAKRLGYINGYRWLVEYPTNGKRPELPDDVEIEWRGHPHHLATSFDKWISAIAGSLRWGVHSGGAVDVAEFRITDQRYKPADTSYLNALTQTKSLTHSEEGLTYKSVDEVSGLIAAVEKCEKMFDEIMKKERENNWHEREEFPPVGVECEVFYAGNFELCFVIGRDKYDNLVVQLLKDGGEYKRISALTKFRPIRTERERFIEAATLVMQPNALTGTMSLWFGKLFDAGFRGPKVEK